MHRCHPETSFLRSKAGCGGRGCSLGGSVCNKIVSINAVIGKAYPLLEIGEGSVYLPHARKKKEKAAL